MVYSLHWIFSFFLCFFYNSFFFAKPVVPGQPLWCVTKQIASSTDVIESKVELLNLDISASDAVVLSEIALLYNDVVALGSRADVVESLANLLDSCQATPFTASTTISLSGFYCLSATNTVGIITVQAATNNVVVDLNGHRVQGVVINSNNQITFRNGTIIGSNQTGVGLDVLSGASNITLQYLDVENAQIGIRMTGASGAFVENCSMSLNFTGIQLNQSTGILIDKTIATANQLAGFSLVSSTTCILQYCKALSTGQGNTTVLNNNVCGFISNQGFGNVFERCIANSTQALSTTDFNSVVAGFMLTGTEQGSKIIGCESANATTSPNGVTIPYGILLQAQLSGLTTVTFLNPGTVNSNLRGGSWSPDGTYLAVGGSSNGLRNIFQIYSFNYLQQTLTRIISVQPDSSQLVNGVAWSPDGNYLAFFSNAAIHLYSFDRDNQTISNLQTIPNASTQTGPVAWSPDGRYLVAGGNGVPPLSLYRFDSVAQTLTLVTSLSPASQIRAVAWSPDGNYLAAGGAITGGAALFMYSFNRGTQTLTLLNSFNPDGGGSTLIRGVAWSPDGEYLAVGGDPLNTNAVIVYRFSPSNPAILISPTAVAIGGNNEVLCLAWSPDGQYLAIGPNFSGSNGLLLYAFDRGSNQLLFKQSANTITEAEAILWSPDGQYLAVGFFNSATNLTLYIYQVLSFPSSNLITNNTVYCNSGAQYPSGIGISGSSIANMIIQNTAYSNPLSPFMVDTSYANVQNVFNQQFGQGPTLLQNIAIGDRQVIQQPPDLAVLARQIYSALLTVTGSLTTAGCSPTTITNSNVIGGTISLTQSGNYCLGSAVTGDIAITGTSVAVNLNGNCVSGDIIISGDDAYVYNGNVIPVAVATTGSINAGIDILALTNRALISNVVVDASTAPTAANTGRHALRTAGIDTQVYNCTLTAGPALNATGSANGTNGGSGIVLTGSATRTIIQNCTIAGNNGGNGGTTTPFGNGGNGGHGIQVQAGSVFIAEISNCLIVATGAGGAPGSVGSTTGGRGGDGVNIDASASDIAVHNCIIRNTGAAGLSAVQTLVTFVDMLGVAPGISVIDNAAGRAVNDFVTAQNQLSIVFANFADTITNPIVYNLNNRQATPGTDPTNGDGGVLVPNPPDATAGGGNVIVNHMVNVFMSVIAS